MITISTGCAPSHRPAPGPADPSGANAIAADDGRLVLVDWTGAGRGTRVMSLATLVAGVLQPHPWVAPSRDLRRIDAVVAGYRPHVQLTSAELERLPSALTAFGIVLDCWSLVFQAWAFAKSHTASTLGARWQTMLLRTSCGHSKPTRAR